MRCVGCGSDIQGPPQALRLKIVDESPEMLSRAKKLGFTWHEWKENGQLEGNFHTNCFQVAVLVWQAAFHTRKFSPRR